MGQKLLESLSERVYSMTDVLFNESDGYNNNMDFQARCSIENAVKVNLMCLLLYLSLYSFVCLMLIIFQ